MELLNNKPLKLLLILWLMANTLLVLMVYFCLPCFGLESEETVDLWGKFTVYLLLFLGFVFYAKYISKTSILNGIILSITGINGPVFLLLAYFERINNTPNMIVLVDFLGWVTIYYSLWFMCCDFYHTQFAPDNK